MSTSYCILPVLAFCAFALSSESALGDEANGSYPCLADQQPVRSDVMHLGSRAHVVYEFGCLPKPNDEFEFVVSFDALRDIAHVDDVALKVAHLICDLNRVAEMPVDLVYVEYLNEDEEQTNFRNTGICCASGGPLPEKCKRALNG